MLAALRYRRGQALLLTVLSAVVIACAVLIPAGLASLQESLVKGRFDALAPINRSLQLTTTTVPHASALSFESMDNQVPSALRAVAGMPVHWTIVQKNVSVDGADTQAVAVDAACEHLQLTSGSCPSGAGQVLVTSALLKRLAVPVGGTVTVRFTGVQPAAAKTFTVAGTYRQPTSDSFWTGRILARSTLPQVAGSDIVDTLVMPAAALDTLVDQVPLSRSSVWPIDGGKLHPSNLDALATASAKLQEKVSAIGGQSSTPFETMQSDVHADLKQARVILPVLLAQLAVLLLVVLALVSSAAVEQRGRELALARLRGRGAGGARRLLVTELGLTMLAGPPLGILLAYAVDWVARTFWLMPGIEPYVGASVLLAALAGAVVILVVLLVTTRPVLRADLAGQLRGSPSTRGVRGARLLDVVVITAAAVAVIAMATGALTGPIALVAPSLLALAVGLALSMILVPLAARWGTRALLHGRASVSLAMLGAARRPAIRRIVAVITVASALAVFSANAYAVGQRNRVERAAVENGAAMAIYPGQTDIGSDWRNILAAVQSVDPKQRTTTALLQVNAGGASSVSVLAGDPAAYERVMAPGPRRPNLAPVRAATVPPVRITGTTLKAVVSTSQLQALVPNYDGNDRDTWVSEGANLATTPDNTPSDVRSGIPGRLHIVPPHLELTIIRADGIQAPVDLGAVSVKAGGTATVSSSIPCAKGCTVAGLDLGHANSPNPGANTVHNPERPGFSGGLTLRGTFSVQWSGAQLDGLADASRWTPTTSTGGQSIAAEPNGPAMQLKWTYTGSSLVMQTKASGATPIVMLSDAVWDQRSTLGAVSGNSVQVPSASGEQDRQATIVGHVPYLPGLTGNAVFMPISAATGSGVRVDGFQVQPLILTSDSSAKHEAAIRGALSAHGLDVLEVTRATDLQRVYDRSASAWGLQFAIAVAIAAVLIAALVLIVVMVMSWRERARDFAGLRLAGTPIRTVRVAALMEQTLVVVGATLVGATCGVVGAALVMKRVPLFATPPTIDVIDVHLATPTVLATLAGTLVTFVVVGVLLGRWLVSRSGLERAKVSA